MPRYLHIYDPSERRLVAAADWALSVAAAPGRLLPWRAGVANPQRILLLRLERIGDLLMTLPAIEAVRDMAPSAEIDLMVGRWNEPLARLLPGLNRIETIDLPWLARDGARKPLMDWIRVVARWRARRYDLGINFEPDIRTNLLLYLSGARRRVGFEGGGGASLLTDRVAFDPTRHTTSGSLDLAATAFTQPVSTIVARYLVPLQESGRPRLAPPDQVRQRAAALLGDRSAPLVGIHASGGRAIKQWPGERFARVATRLAYERGATILLTGSSGDRSLVDRVKSAIPADVPVVDLCGSLDLVSLAAVLERLHLLITGDTGPMHLADAVGTPVLGVFGLSDPRRYGPVSPTSRVVRIDLPCSPCNRVRMPPARCVGGTPDCLDGIGADQVYDSAVDLLRRSFASPGREAARTGTLR